jgi:hypothetical protein
VASHAFPDDSLVNCTINSLRSRLTATGQASDYDLLIGQKSFGRYLQDEGFDAMPGPKLPVAGLSI